MSEEMIVRHCSPTLAGLKTGNLFSCSYQDRGEILGFLREWNTKLRSKGVRLIPLRLQENKALIYVYRPSHLSRDFNDAAVCDLLSQHGYCTESCEKCVVELMKRIRQNDDFPPRMRSGCSSAIRARTSRALSRTRRRAPNASAAGRSTATRTKRRNSLSASRNVQGFIKNNMRAADR